MAPGQRIVKKYGIGEWYCSLFTALNSEERSNNAKAALKAVREADKPCYFKDPAGSLRCNKNGGVCSIRHYEKLPDSSVQVCLGEDSRLITLCPNRFLQNNSIFHWVGRELLQNSRPRVLQQVDFLKSTVTNRSAGRIDNVLVTENSNGSIQWCALEIQAVYFSGTAMKNEFNALLKNTAPLPFPVKNTRPDFRSSAPKRLMPQLQIKVPTLRRWGKKMAVIIDLPFFQSLGPMVKIDSLSNCDIVWFIVDFDAGKSPAEIQLAETYYTTLENAVEGLTAGVPMSLTDFENEIRKKLLGNK